MAGLTGCGNEGIDPGGQVDAGSVDAGPPPGEGTPCKSDKECTALEMVCDKSVGACYQCLSDGDCLGDTLRCITKRCIAVQVCKSDADCPGGVCHPADERCVGCVSDKDCGDQQRCKGNACVALPPPCKSSKDCIPTGQVCDKDAGRCADCVIDADCESGEVCAGGSCGTPVCTPGATRCLGKGAVETCTSNGGRYEAKDCPAGQTCADGACRSKLCDEGLAACIGGLKGTCDAAGTGLTSPVSCAAGQVCIAGECAPEACTAGSSTCVNLGEKAVCGSANTWQISACAPGEVCASGACQTPSCTAGATLCQGTRVVVCNASGTAKTVQENCGEVGKTCKEGACVKANACTPNTIVCSTDFSATQTCKADGSGYVTIKCPPNSLCKQGKCTSVVCTAGELFCDGEVVRKCNGDGTGAEEVQACAATTQCAQGACIPKQCSPGASTCKSKTVLLTCKSDGTSYVEVGCPAGCKDGACGG